MLVDDAIERLSASGLFREVGGATDLAEALEQLNGAWPKAFVVVPTQRAEPNKLTGRHRQRVAMRLSVVLGVKRAAARRDAPRDELSALVEAVKPLFAGWKAADADTAFDFAAGSVRSIADGVVWFELLFDAAGYLTVGA